MTLYSIVEMVNGKFDFNNPPKKNSSRHHYIPRFFLDGFANSDGLLYVFDKEKNRILKNPRPPKAIFFETDRNTIRLTENLESSIIEDELYSQIDSTSSKVIRYFREEELKRIDFNSDNTAQFQFFLITLFWRIPKTDFAANDVMDRSEINSLQIDPELLRSDPAFRKIHRASLVQHHINEMVKHGKKGKFSVNIHQPPNNLFVVGDNPLLFRKMPTLFSEFNESDFLIAIASDRIYSSTNEIFNVRTQENWMNYNAAVIDQSTKYVACGKLEFLNQSIEYYDALKNEGLNYSVAERAFKTN